MDSEIQKALAQLNRTMGQLLLAERLKSLGAEPIKEIWYDNVPVKFFLPDALDDRIQSLLLTHGKFFEEPLLAKVQAMIPTGSHVVDVGANIGNHTLFFSKICKAEKVVSFEPQKRLASIIRRNIELNAIDTDRVRVVEAGCGAQNSRFSMLSGHVANLGATQFKYDEAGGFDVRRLDDCELGRVDFIKIDAERLGDEVLLGARHTIEHFNPIIWIELYDGERERAIAFLEAVGYELHERMTQHDFIFTSKDAASS
jgi:FkbM family methyltransferase